MIFTPRSFKTARFFCVASSLYMTVFMAGQTIRMASVAIKDVVSISSATPPAIFAITLAVAGAMTYTPAHLASETCSTSKWGLGANISPMTAFFERVSNVRGDTNSFACSVITTFTPYPALTRRETSSHVLYAAIPPVTPTTTFLFTLICRREGRFFLRRSRARRG